MDLKQPSISTELTLLKNHNYFYYVILLNVIYKRITLIKLRIMFFSAIFILICIAMLATASIGMECYNNNDAWQNSHESNYDYLIAAIVLPILMIIGAGLKIYYDVKTGNL